jgi:hypothetical protein
MTERLQFIGGPLDGFERPHDGSPLDGNAKWALMVNDDQTAFLCTYELRSVANAEPAVFGFIGMQRKESAW